MLHIRVSALLTRPRQQLLSGGHDSRKESERALHIPCVLLLRPWSPAALLGHYAPMVHCQ